MRSMRRAISGRSNPLNGMADLRMQIVRVGLNYKFGGPAVSGY
jgi:hypothetical protein